ncbi:MAG: Gfo/Idh/MocA family oxidoreductase [Candidatus Marinimicrobia bacterium]|jgi:predicted dehydrogenase|nr:Gfo/Idh/MocA family oxidoreductase [Candidatus Neomarinimicrobiota bacterium]MBT7899373.1 Gfo/Idh/MocA family oxidoreductase [Candidatus Neomarinimicrobiota bacterium]
MPLQIGIIGYGYMGEIRHRTLIQHKNIDLSMICETNKKILFDEQNITVVRNPLEVIESNVDAVFICTPNHLIPKLAIECLERGKHVFCEKPPGRTLEDIVQMRNAENRNLGTKLMFGFNHRYHPGVLRAKSIVDSGRMGKIIALRGLYGKSGGKNFDKSWRNDFKISGGGILLDQGIHMLDLFNYFLGGFTSVKSFLSNGHWGFDVEDNAIVILKNDHGQLAMLHSSATFWKHMFQLNVILEKGYLSLEGLLSKTGSYGRENLVIGRRQFEDEAEALGNPSEETIYFDKDRSWEIEVNQFINCILDDKPVIESNSTDAYNAMELIHRCYQDSSFTIYQSEAS